MTDRPGDWTRRTLRADAQLPGRNAAEKRAERLIEEAVALMDEADHLMVTAAANRVDECPICEHRARVADSEAEAERLRKIQAGRQSRRFAVMRGGRP